MNDDENIILVARFEAKAGFGTKITNILLSMADEVKNKEPGCLAYLVHRSLENDDVVLLYESYKDREALEAHRETPFFKELVEGQVVPLLAVRQRELYSICREDYEKGMTRRRDSSRR